MEIIDRRHTAKKDEAVEGISPSPTEAKMTEQLPDTPAEPVVIPEPENVWGEKLHWQEITYMIGLMGLGDNNFCVTGRAVGLRSDGFPCVAIYIFQPFYEEEFDWQEVAKERLDTFLPCACRKDGPCPFHGKQVVAWIEEGLLRLNRMRGKEAPAPIKALNMLEQELETNLVSPTGKKIIPFH